MRFLFFIVSGVLFTIASSIGQERRIPVEFTIKNQPIKELDFYVVDGDKRSPLRYDRESMVFNEPIDSDTLTILLCSSGHSFEFMIQPKEMHYLKIEGNRRFFGGWVYEVNQGFEYNELVKKSKKKCK